MADARDALRAAVLWLFGRIPPRLYQMLRSSPIGTISRHVLDVVLPRRGWQPVRVRAGPLRGMILELEPRDHKEMIVGHHEPVVAATIHDLLSEGGRAFDVGAHVGYLALVMARKVGPRGSVAAFEPDPIVWDQLQRNLQRNAPGTVPVRAAVGARKTRGRFGRGSTSTLGRLDPRGDLDVEVTTLDDALERFGIPDLVKIDVEGGELDVLRGAEELIRRKETMFVIEAHSPGLEEQCRALLVAAGYRCQRLEEGPKAGIHLLAIPDDHHSGVRGTQGVP